MAFLSFHLACKGTKNYDSWVWLCRLQILNHNSKIFPTFAAKLDSKKEKQ